MLGEESCCLAPWGVWIGQCLSHIQAGPVTAKVLPPPCLVTSGPQYHLGFWTAGLAGEIAAPSDTRFHSSICTKKWFGWGWRNGGELVWAMTIVWFTAFTYLEIVCGPLFLSSANVGRRPAAFPIISITPSSQNENKPVSKVLFIAKRTLAVLLNVVLLNVGINPLRSFQKTWLLSMLK